MSFTFLRFWGKALISLNIYKGQTDLVSGKTEKELFPDLQYPLKFSN